MLSPSACALESRLCTSVTTSGRLGLVASGVAARSSAVDGVDAAIVPDGVAPRAEFGIVDGTAVATVAPVEGRRAIGGARSGDVSRSIESVRRCTSRMANSESCDALRCRKFESAAARLSKCCFTSARFSLFVPANRSHAFIAGNTTAMATINFARRFVRRSLFWLGKGGFISGRR